MELVIGATGGLAACAFATWVGYDRGRALYPVMLTVIASYYLLFAVMGGSGTALALDGLVMVGFLVIAVVGFKGNLWLVVLALLAHGLLDLAHGRLISNPGAPTWWPAFCLGFDLSAAAYLASRLWLLARTSRASRRGRTTRASALAILAAGALFGGDSQAVTRGALRTAQVDGREIAYRVAGQGRPVIVLVSGMGQGMSSFATVAPELAKSATVITYDRAGYGLSGAPDGFRDAAAIDRELLGLLRASSVKGPYILAGHSTGGLYAEYFAAQHPELVSGLVLIDTRPADFTERCRQAGLQACAATPSMVRFAPKGAQAEVAALHRAAAEVRALMSPALPTLVLSRAVSARPSPFERIWSAAQAALAKRHRGAIQMIAPQGGHDIHHDARTWFIAAVTRFARSLG